MVEYVCALSFRRARLWHNIATCNIAYRAHHSSIKHASITMAIRIGFAFNFFLPSA